MPLADHFALWRAFEPKVPALPSPGLDLIWLPITSNGLWAPAASSLAEVSPGPWDRRWAVEKRC